MILFRASCICLCLTVTASFAAAQSLKVRIPITVSDSGIKVSTGRLTIGFHPDATTCLDESPLTGFINRWSEYESDKVREMQDPPAPGFMLQFAYPATICPSSPYTEDIHKSVGATQIDTFRFVLQLDATQGDDLHSVKFRWPKVLSEFADSVFLVRAVGTVRFRVDMAQQDTFVIPWSLSTYGNKLNSVLLIIKNPKTPPVAPVVSATAPENDASNVSLTPTFQWDAVPQADYYHIQVARDTFFAGINLVRTDTLSGGAASLALTTNLAQSTTYYWRILVSNPYGVSYYQSRPLRFQTGLAGAVDPSKDGIPSSFALAQNYPNPFNPTTEIRYQLAERSHVSLKVFDSLGREVRMLVDEVEEAGFKSVTFDAKNLPSGEYTYRLTAGTFIEVKRMLFVK